MQCAMQWNARWNGMRDAAMPRCNAARTARCNAHGERLVLSRRPERPVSTLRNAKDVRRWPRVRVGVRCDRGRAVDVQLSEGVDRDEDAPSVGVDLIGRVSARCAVEDARLVEVDECRVVVGGAIGGRVGRIELAPVPLQQLAWRAALGGHHLDAAELTLRHREECAAREHALRVRLVAQPHRISDANPSFAHANNRHGGGTAHLASAWLALVDGAWPYLHRDPPLARC